MKAETPLILWHCEQVKKVKPVNAGLTSVSVHDKVLVTASNVPDVHLWKLGSKIDFMLALDRHDGAVNAVSFSPDGRYLCTASGTTGSIVLWTPFPHRNSWTSLTRQADLNVQILHVASDGLTDISWSSDSQRLIVSSVDASVVVIEKQTSNNGSVNWKVVYKNGMDHTHFVQGVAFDPLGVYLASMSSDRTVRVWSRKQPKRKKKKDKQLQQQPPNSQNLQQGKDGTNPTAASIALSTATATATSTMSSTPLVMAARSKLLRSWKFLPTTAAATSPPVPDKQKVISYCDEGTLASFVRRLAWTTDGAYLVTPAARDGDRYCTLLFRRHAYDEPCRILGGLEKPSVAVVPNPVLFSLPSQAKEVSCNEGSTKENVRSSALPYRSIFCVLTWDTVYLYDTYHTEPIAVVRGLHYANLVDAAWSADGHSLIVCSTDGYVSFLTFEEGELGQVYKSALSTATNTPVAVPLPKVAPAPVKALPPCEPGRANILQARPKKKAKLQQVQRPVPEQPTEKRAAADEVMAAGVDQLSLDTCNVLQPKKKVKRVAVEQA